MEFAILYGSQREGRQGIKAAKWMVKKVQEAGHDAVLVDSQEYDLPILQKTFGEYDPAPENLQKLHDVLARVDGYVIVSGEYNHSIPPGLTNMMDHFMPEYFWKPAGIATYSAGPFGGVRAAVHLRAFVSELGMPTVPTMFAISKVQSSFDDDGNAVDAAYDERIKGKFLQELFWYAEACKAQRDKGTPY